MTLLNDADAIYHGANAADAVFLGSNEVWKRATGLPVRDGLAIWYDASQLALADGATLASWPDVSGNNNHGVIKGTGGPRLRANTLNGKPVVRFDGNQGRLRATGINVQRDYTLVYVVRMWGSFYGRVVTATYPPQNFLLGYWNAFEDVAYCGAFFTPDTRKSFTSDWIMYSADAQASAYAPRMFRDGVLLATGGANDHWGDTLNISGYAADSAEESCDCDIAELVLYRRKLSDAERQSVEAYMRGKYAL